MRALGLLLVCLPLAISASPTFADARSTRQAVAGWTDRAPTIDGKLDDAAWGGVKELAGFSLMEPSNRPPEAATHVKALTDGKALYLAFRCVEPKMARLKTEKRERDDRPWADDCVEVVIDSTNERRQLYHFIANADGSIYDGLATVEGPETFKEDAKWDGTWQVATSKGNGEWTAEWRIPFETIGVSLDKSPCLGVNFARERFGARFELSSWSGSRGKPFSCLMMAWGISGMPAFLRCNVQSAE